jgi:DNA (cytosine-5)-methyltransferase 1
MKIKVIELFAGVGGFRLGLEGWQKKSPSSKYKEAFSSPYEVVWSNQWEPSTKTQHASIVYENRWGKKNHSDKDIASVHTANIPAHDMLVGGFPCQDYSVATTLKNSKGLIGKKGVLWWSIHRILSETKKPTKYLFLENVDRLLISPASQRGRDFAIILQSLNQLGYAVEWKVINAAEYGMPQKRKRVYILGYHKSTSIYKKLAKAKPNDWITDSGVFPTAFPTKCHPEKGVLTNFELNDDIVEISNNFNNGKENYKFENAGIMIKGKVYTIKTTAIHNGGHTHLKDILLTQKVEDEFYISKEERKKWEALKNAKSEERTNSAGIVYFYKEGGMPFPDPLDKPARTIITGEGGRSPSRFKHAVQSKTGLRRLTPVELERLNMFPDNHTLHEDVSNTKRAFFMGNALVVGVVERIGITLKSFL